MEYIIIDGKPEPYDRWQHLQDTAYMIDCEPHTEVEFLSGALASFPPCSPDADWPGYAVRSLLESLLLNRGYELQQDCPAVVPTASVRSPGDGDVEPFA